MRDFIRALSAKIISILTGTDISEDEHRELNTW